MVIRFENNVSEHRRLSITKHPAFNLMLGVVALNQEKMSPVCCEWGYRLTSSVKEEALETNVVPCVMNIAKKIDYVVQRTERPHTWQRLCRTGWTPLLTKRILIPTVTQFEPPLLQLVDAHWRKGWQDTPQQPKWAQCFCELRIAVDEEWLHQEGLQEFPTSIGACCYCQRALMYCLLQKWFNFTRNYVVYV